MPPRRSPRTREDDLSFSGLDPLPANTSSNEERASKKFKSSGTNKTETEAAGDIEDSIQLTQQPETILKQLEAEKKAKEKKMEDIEKKLGDMDMKITTTQQRIDDLAPLLQQAMSEDTPSHYYIENLESQLIAIKKSLTSDTLESPRRQVLEVEKAEVETKLTDALRKIHKHEKTMADFAAKERALNNDRDRYERDYLRLQRSLEKLEQECDLLTTKILTPIKDATCVDTSPNSSSSAQDAADAMEAKKVRVSCP